LGSALFLKGCINPLPSNHDETFSPFAVLLISVILCIAFSNLFNGAIPLLTVGMLAKLSASDDSDS